MRTFESNLNYEKYHQLQANFGGLKIPYVSKLGLPNWNSTTISDELIANQCQVNPNHKILLLGCGKGISAAILAKTLVGGNLWTTDIYYTALECTKQTLKQNNLENCTVYDDLSLLPEHKNTFDAAVIILPKGRKLARRWLLEAKELLDIDKEIYIVGANSDGIQSVIKDAEALLGTPSHILGYKKGNRIAKLIKRDEKTDSDWSSEPGIAPYTWQQFKINFDSTTISISSIPGVFSYQQLDEGTAFLLKNLQMDVDDRLLDIGCGYGIIGLSAASQFDDALKIDMVDNNNYAIACCKRNVNENIPISKREKIRIIGSDLLSDLLDQKYSLIVSNPPFHSGKAIDYSIASAMFKQTAQVLEKNGRFVIVANKFIRYEKLLDSFFAKVTVLAQNNRYHVIEAAQVYK